MTRDGVRITWSVHGSGPPLLYVRGWLSHLDEMWAKPGYRRLMLALGRHYTVYRYDMRGTGVSQRSDCAITPRALVAELADVMGVINDGPVTLYATTFGVPTAIQYAADNPDRLSALILDGGYAEGRKITSWLRRQLLIFTLRYFPEMAFLLLSGATQPKKSPNAQSTLELGERMALPKIAAKLYRLGFSVNVTAQLEKLRLPTLILHRQDSQSVPARLAHELAEQIPGAQLRLLPGDAHNSYEGDLQSTLVALAEFLGVRLMDSSDPQTVSSNEVEARPFCFASYAHTDADTVREVTDVLTAMGVNCWQDTAIPAGSIWREEIAQQVQNCDLFLFFVSAASIHSEHCEQEASFATEEGKPIIVIYLEDTVMSPSLRLMLSNRQAIKHFALSHEQLVEKLESGVARVLEATKRSATSAR